MADALPSSARSPPPGMPISLPSGCSELECPSVQIVERYADQRGIRAELVRNRTVQRQTALVDPSVASGHYAHGFMISRAAKYSPANGPNCRLQPSFADNKRLAVTPLACRYIIRMGAANRRRCAALPPVHQEYRTNPFLLLTNIETYIYSRISEPGKRRIPNRQLSNSPTS